MTLELRTRALLDLIEAHRRGQCAALVRAADQQAEAALAQARAEARARVREAFTEERARAQARVAAARAELQTQRRRHDQRLAAHSLALAWQRLPQALQARWAESATRRQWVDAAAAEARRVLPRGSWRIVHAAGWPQHDSQALASRLRAEIGAAVAIVEDAALEAGLRIVADGNAVDATLAGLIADREAIGARLLAELGSLT